MQQRYLLEITGSAEQAIPDRMTLYDFESRSLLNEIEGDEWLRLLRELQSVERNADATEQDTPALQAPEDRGETGSETSGIAPGQEDESSEAIELYRPPEQELDPVRSGRRKLWDMPHKYHCPIIGTCLSVDDLRRIGRRFVWRTKERLSDYEIHVGFVSAAEERNALSQATQKLLDKKYASNLRRYAKAKDPEGILALWAESLACGEVPGGLWALMSHPKTDAATMVLAYEDVHMLSHQIGAGQRADLKRLNEARVELGRVRHELETCQRRSAQQLEQRESTIAELTSELDACRQERDRLASEAETLRHRLSRSETPALLERIASLSDAHALTHSRLETSLQETESLRQRLADAERRSSTLETSLREREEECESLERLLTLGLSQQCDECPNDSCACCADLAGRLVLCVGGRQQLVEQYRQLVARCNGRFEHHDGGLEDSHQRLESMLASADAIVCATDYVSHNAYYRTKRFCKRLDKPHVLLGNSGLSSFARALERVAN
ncbi:DUF2325 domain-containing protein [Imhoffiella purpurea]|uniref:DUF2325 domain-containing protein n=1 Tax=Imhoffiella purpurea TaxID=1249627 RepID=W9VAV8_9GAMM|nr:DUF2325 domain-containing protein [Imhoffiella purpurea]EXJ14066.1 hypothetical protein D779_3028 [Imhoffiella purpurea]